MTTTQIRTAIARSNTAELIIEEIECCWNGFIVLVYLRPFINYNMITISAGDCQQVLRINRIVRIRN